MPRRRPSWPLHKRLSFLLYYKNICSFCDAPISDTDYWEICHLVAHSRGGEMDFDNCRPGCRSCNEMMRDFNFSSVDLARKWIVMEKCYQDAISQWKKSLHALSKKERWEIEKLRIEFESEEKPY